jgi:hypothetical protein
MRSFYRKGVIGFREALSLAAAVGDDVSMGMAPSLCPGCLHVRLVPGGKSTFLLCRLSQTDPSFPRYPRQPVMTCRGYEAGPEQDTAGDLGTVGLDNPLI